MSIAKVIELSSSSPTSVEDAVKRGIAKASETVKGIQGAWVNEIKAICGDGGQITEWRVNLRITFVIE